jgi:metal-dependent amidase/aminoacylase/carboxypeptidase family protein
MLGVRRPEWDPPKVNHNAAFDMDEDVLPVGSAILAATALRYLAVGR